MTSEKKLYVKKSEINRKGVFTQRRIPKGELIRFMRGREISVSQLKKRYELGKERENLTDPFQIAKRKYLLLKKPCICINHSCLPNGGIRKKNELRALRNIQKDEEITYDYSTTEWEDVKAWGGKCDIYKKLWKMQCNCKSKKCRKIIKEFPFLPSKLKKKYQMQHALPSHILKRRRRNKL